MVYVDGSFVGAQTTSQSDFKGVHREEMCHGLSYCRSVRGRSTLRTVISKCCRPVGPSVIVVPGSQSVGRSRSPPTDRKGDSPMVGVGQDPSDSKSIYKSFDATVQEFNAEEGQ